MGNACCNYAANKDPNHAEWGKKPLKTDPALTRALTIA